MTEPSILFARQPILDARLRLHAYELLFRGPRDINRSRDGDRATSEVLVESMALVENRDLNPPVPAFVNITKTMLFELTAPPVDPGTVVFELLENIAVDVEVVQAVERLKGEGYRIALDDFEFDESWRPLLPLADIIKIDVLGRSPEELRKLLSRLRGYPATLLAEKVETREMFEACRDMGFELFQGYFFAQPEIVRGRKLSPGANAMLDIMSRINRDDVDIRELSDAIHHDAALSFKLLKLMNSAAFSQGRTIDSVADAIRLLGLRRLRCWVNVLLLAGVSGKAQELLRLLIVRAKMSELLAAELAIDVPDRCFTAALFSGIDAVLDADLGFLLKELPVGEEMRQALLAGEGELGDLVVAVIAYERGNWSLVEARLPLATPGALWSAYRRSLQWAGDVMGTL